MRNIIIILSVILISCGQSGSKNETAASSDKTAPVVVKDQKDNLQVVTHPVASEQSGSSGNISTDNAANQSTYTGAWTGQGQDRIEISFSNGVYFIKMDADNSGKPIVKAKEEGGKLIVDPGIYYGYNGMSTLTPVGSKKLVLRSGKNTYTYER